MVLKQADTVDVFTPVPRRVAWWLILAFLIFVAWFVLAMSALAQTGVQNAADLTPEQFDAIRLGWHAMWIVYAGAVLAGAAGMSVLNRRLGAGGGGLAVLVSQVLVAASAVSVVGQLVVAQVVADFDGPKLSDDPLWRSQLLLSMVAIWTAMAAVVTTGVALRLSGFLRRTGLVVAISAGVVLVADVVLGGAFPPLLVGFFWLVYGIGLARQPVPSIT